MAQVSAVIILVEFLSMIKHLQETRYRKYNAVDDVGSAEHGEMLRG